MTASEPKPSAALEPYLWWPALTAASLGGLFAPVAWASDIQDSQSEIVSCGLAFVLVVLFLRILFDRRCRMAIDAVNAETQKYGASIWKMLFHDPVWGLFGSRAGGRYLTWARVILMVEFMIMMLLNGGDGLHQPFLIATASFAIVTVLILAQLKNHYPACTCVKSP